MRNPSDERRFTSEASHKGGICSFEVVNDRIWSRRARVPFVPLWVRSRSCAVVIIERSQVIFVVGCVIFN
jgi:hypothetical protein